MYDARPMRAASLLPALAAATLALAPASAWTGPTRVRMIDDATKLMPKTLRMVLTRHREDVLRGMLAPMADEDAPAHRPPWDGGTLDASVDGAREALVSAVAKGAPFAEIARRFGTLAHFVADAGFPPGAAGKSGADHYAHFAAFCESRLPRFPLVFYGHDQPDLARGDFPAFARSVLARARAQDGDLARAYAQAPSRHDPASFDDRSIPFAIGSLAFSHTVTDVVRAWIAAWRQCHGDLGATPYLAAPAPHDRRGSSK